MEIITGGVSVVVTGNIICRSCSPNIDRNRNYTIISLI